MARLYKGRQAGRWGVIAIGALALAGSFAPAKAQEMLVSPAAVAACLCQEQSVATLSNEVANGHRAYEERRREIDDLNLRVDQGRDRVNVNNPSEVEAYKQLLDRRDQAQARFSDEVAPNYAALVARYNQAVGTFNGSCSGKSYESRALAQARSNLVCPRQ